MQRTSVARLSQVIGPVRLLGNFQFARHPLAIAAKRGPTNASGQTFA
jgi:hypothetical protein